jgi:amino acid adenylation domain-containing protein
MIAKNVGFRISAQQERIWSLQAGQESPYRTRCEVLVDGPADPGKLREAIEDVVREHEILRTVFQRQTGLIVPFQVIQEESAINWRSIDLSELDSQAKDREIRKLTGEIGALDTGPLLGAVLARLSAGKSVLVLSLPTLCADVVSMGNLVEAIGRACASSGVERQPEVLQYADFSEWQEELRSGKETVAGGEYWRDYCRQLDFSSDPSVLASFEEKSAGVFAPAVVSHEITLHVANAPAFLLACWQVFLARVTGHSTLLIGCETGSRKYEELRDAIGPLATYLPLKFTVDTGDTVAGLTQKTRFALDDAAKWQESFAWSQVCPAEEATALQLGFDYAELPLPVHFGDLQFTTRRIDACYEKFILKLSARQRADRAALDLHYDASRLAPETVEAWSREFTTMMAAAAADPMMAAFRLPLLTTQESHRVLVDWNQTAADYPRESCIHELIEQQVARTPGRIAVRCQGEALTYAELNSRANQLARALRTAGAGPGKLVALCLERGIGMIAGLLGILKTGAAYVPLSAGHPKPRLAAQLNGAVALLTEKEFLQQLPEFAGGTICVDCDPDAVSGEPAPNSECGASPEDLAYVIYTSGSTGKPKGVAVRHRNLVNYAWFISRMLRLEDYPDGLAFATVSTLSADLGNTCIYPALISGGCLDVIPHDVSSDSQRLIDSNSRAPVDVLKIVPSHLAALLDAGGGKAILPRRFLILGGEALTTGLLGQIRALAPDCEIFNHYGPTETTVGSLTLRLRDYTNRDRTAGSIPIGRPIANTQVYILDSHREPVPPGVTGELYIGGDGVTAGYLNQPELTAERFLPDPFAKTGSLYRTGDLARFLPDGNVQFLGRVDDQVKIRGFRIELGEIEAALRSHGTVAQAVTLARPDSHGNVRLVAYVVPQSGSSADANVLRDHLKGLLPDYMVPSALVVLPKLPLNANGKVDRQNLPEPEESVNLASVFVAPRTPIEIVIAGIWAEVLHRDQVGANDNFFEIGGHSLLATQVISRVRRNLEFDPPLRVLFESPTVAALASWIDEARRSGQGLSLPPITPASNDQPLPLSFAQQRLWVIDQLDPGNPLYNVPRALRMKGLLNVEALGQALNEIIRRHASQRTTFEVKDGSPVQVVAAKAEMAMPIRDLTLLPEAEREDAAREVARKEAVTPFDLAKGPLVRAQLVRLAPDDHVFLLTAHHIVTDGWSAGIFLSELGTLYDAFSQRKPSPLADPVVQYADYAVWQRRWIEGPVLDRQLDYWRDQLKEAPAVLELPTDRPRSATASYDGAFELIWLPADLWDEIRIFSRKEDVTPFMTLLAAYQVLLSRYSGQEKIVVGTDVANRTSAETETLIGFFINVLAMCADVSGNPTFREVLKRVRSMALGAYAHQDMPFDKLVKDLQPDRNTSHSPIVQSLFVMQNIPNPGRSLAGLELSNFDMPLTQSKFDLALFMSVRDGKIAGYWVYRTALFDASTMRRMGRHYETLLRNAVAEPETRLSALEILNEEEKQQRDKLKKGRRESLQSKLAATQVKGASLAPDTPDWK